MQPRDGRFLLSAFQLFSISAFQLLTSASMSDLLEGLPGEALVREGLVDYQSGRRTIPACLVGMASPRLRRMGLIPQPGPGFIAEPELQLYRLLGGEGGDAYSRYNALVRELVSFEQALDRRMRKSGNY
jgi:hypothetical protein